MAGTQTKLVDFGIAAAEAEEDANLEEDWLEIPVSAEDVLIAYRPTESQIALFSAAFGDAADETAAMGAVMRFLRHTLDKEGYKFLVDRMAQRPGIPIEKLMEVVAVIMENFTGNPSLPSSASTSQRQVGGQRLTDHLPPKGSTRSRSPRGGSTTSSTSGS